MSPPADRTTAIENDVAAVLASARTAFARAGISTRVDGPDHRETLTRLVEAVCTLVEDGTPAAAGTAHLMDLGIRACDLLAVIGDRSRDARTDVLHVQTGLGRLQDLTTTWELVDAVCAEVIRTCGFRRVLLSWVDADSWRPWKFAAQDDPALERSFIEMIDGLRMPVDATPFERRILAERRPVLVRDARRDRTPMTVAIGSTSYVVAPITPAGRVLGLLHADNGADGIVDEIDRDLLWTFAEGFGRIYERTELVERLDAQRAHTLATMRVIEHITDTVDQTTVDFVDEAGRGGVRPPSGGHRPSPSVDLALTVREREVLDLIVRGYDNARIGRELSIAPGTAKTHVSRILRKLGADNRSELVGMVLRPPE